MALATTDTFDSGVNPDWSAYASAYDLLSKHNPEYKLLLQDFEDFLASHNSLQLICDVGGGTGNYTEIAARACPGSKVCLIEPDAEMMGAARAKLRHFGNVTYQNVPLENAEAAAADLVVCVHALYAMPAPEQRLAEIRRMLKPGGLFYLVDLGRLMDVADWRRFLFSSLRKEHGLLGAVRIFWQGREIAKQNKAILTAQKNGTYWTHSGDELASAVKAAGFEILRQRPVYRGYSDQIVCRAVE
ncbi:MAG: class I SAM-dependent methyltransferase [Roseovarius sp.]